MKKLLIPIIMSAFSQNSFALVKEMDVRMGISSLNCNIEMWPMFEAPSQLRHTLSLYIDSMSMFPRPVLLAEHGTDTIVVPNCDAMKIINEIVDQNISVDTHLRIELKEVNDVLMETILVKLPNGIEFSSSKVVQ